jgi:hypothetical protein
VIRTALIGLALVVLSCTSSSLIEGDAPETTSDFDVVVTQLNNPPVQRAPAIDVKFEVAVLNRTTEPVTVEHISLESLGAGEYSVPFRSRPFHRSVAPGVEEKFEFWASTRVGDPIVGTTGPLMLRTTLTVTTPGGKRTEAFIRNVNDWLGFGATGNLP